MSVKEAVNVAKSNNFMGLVCQQRLLSLAPALIDSVKAAGLVVVSDASGISTDDDGRKAQSSAGRTPVFERVDGVLGSNGVLTFMDSVDI